MSNKILIGGNEYRLVSNFKKDDKLRSSFNKLTENIFGFNFEKWYEYGYWSDNYIPYSLVDKNANIVSNISVNIIDFIVLGEIKRYIQLGTVMTDEKYRGNGLSKALMEIVLSEWETKSDMIYLFANDTVLDFYPKFKFKKSNEYQYLLDLSYDFSNIFNLKKLDMKNYKDREFIYKKVCESLPQYDVAMLNYPSLDMFYFTCFMSESIYYIEQYDALIICDFDEDTIYIHSIYSDKDIDLKAIINHIPRDKQDKVVLGFAPKDRSLYKREILKEDDSTLFVYSDNENVIEANYLRFPGLSHA